MEHPHATVCICQCVPSQPWFSAFCCGPFSNCCFNSRWCPKYLQCFSAGNVAFLQIFSPPVVALHSITPTRTGWSHCRRRRERMMPAWTWKTNTQKRYQVCVPHLVAGHLRTWNMHGTCTHVVSFHAYVCKYHVYGWWFVLARLTCLLFRHFNGGIHTQVTPPLRLSCTPVALLTFLLLVVVLRPVTSTRTGWSLSLSLSLFLSFSLARACLSLTHARAHTHTHMNTVPVTLFWVFYCISVQS